MPVTVPVDDPTEMPGPGADQDPPVVASLSVVVAPMQTFSVPVIAAGIGFTVTGVVI